jgi:hypothetical protein
VHWLSRAGELARGRHEMEEAVELFTRAVELSDDRVRAGRRSGERSARRRRCGTTGRGCASPLARLDGPLDDAERADTYAFLAFQSSIRSAMWSIR